MDDHDESYARAGVNLAAGAEAVSMYEASATATHIPGVLGGIGNFGGLFSLRDAGIDLADPVLVSATDGIGTKLKLAFELNRHDSIGQDCVAMCVNDVIAVGARPLFFLDYLATGKLDPHQAAEVVRGIANACRESECALLGGETAEMPGFYAPGEYDVAGFCVGICDRSALFDPTNVREGDVLVGLRSNGFHSNGYSLVRKIVTDNKLNLHSKFGATTWGEALLRPTRLYGSAMKVARQFGVRAAAHITGGGFYENIPRALPKGLGAHINEPFTCPSVVVEICKLGNLSDREQHSVFNMGIGMVLVVTPEEVDNLLAAMQAAGESAVRMGVVRLGDGVSIDGID